MPSRLREARRARLFGATTFALALPNTRRDSGDEQRLPEVGDGDQEASRSTPISCASTAWTRLREVRNIGTTVRRP
jgi:hypothetical protein